MKTTEELLAHLLNHLALKFNNQLILKGGMLLRLLNSPRSTQDLDYCWVRTKKRNIFGQEVKETLESLEGVRVTRLEANSRGIFLDVADRNSNVKAKVEIGVVKSMPLPPVPLATTSLSQPYSLASRIVSTMDLAEAFSHKIAASLERNLMRDLFDLAQMEPLTNFDAGVLKMRLAKLSIGRAKPREVSFREAAAILRRRMERLTQKDLEKELLAVLPQEKLTGGSLVIRASMSRTIQKLEILES